ncbi:hypothetical protein Q6D67_12115 [Haliea sp. E1-2-M8]|uniref:hypothetical protein n=1 Tax=Haliea sp. E1-2-M8 TaxID=3064706 RepID=UPI002722BF6B|nr:hypothetical protein [Haliea sp. E1-2-M8]MDO8862446.1 hypothetical protein [Haliea sp. E1-2-M8]
MSASRHPQIGSYGTLLLSLGFAAGLTALLTTVITLRASLPEQAQSAPLPVATLLFQQEDSYQETLRLTGLLQARERAQLAFEVPGLLLSLDAREGERVAARAVLGQLDTRQLEARRAAAAADLASVEADLELARLRSERSTQLPQLFLLLRPTKWDLTL